MFLFKEATSTTTWADHFYGSVACAPQGGDEEGGQEICDHIHVRDTLGNLLVGMLVEDSGETFRDSSNSKGDGNFEIVNGTLDPGTT